MEQIKIPEFEYIPGQLTAARFARAGQGWSFHQGPMLYQFSDERLVNMWSAYDGQECSNDGALLYAESHDLGNTWSTPVLWMKSPNAVASHVSLLETRPSGITLMPFAEGHFVGTQEDKRLQRVTKWANYGATIRRVFIRRSYNGGVSWEPPAELLPELIVGYDAPPFFGVPHQLIQLRNDVILMSAAYLHPDHRDPQHFHQVILRSTDEGETWTKQLDFTVPEERGAMEPWIVELDDGELFCVLRNKSGRLYQMRSMDYGSTWVGPEKSEVRSVESMSKMIRLVSGDILLVWNDASSVTQRPRHPLSAVLSADGGRTWGEPKILADELGLNQLSNHDVIQLTDGRILVCLSHYHAQRPACSDLDMLIFDEAWLKS